MSEEREEDLLADPLFVGLTRPTMIMGVTYQAIIINMMITVCFFLVPKNPLYLLIAFPIHAVFYGICAHDPRAFELIVLWCRTKLANRNRFFWKASSYSPLPYKKR